MDRRRESGAVVVRVKGGSARGGRPLPRPAAGRPPPLGASATRRWLRRDVSPVKLAAAIVVLAAVVAMCMSARSHYARQAQARHQAEYAQHATQPSATPASARPSQKPMDQEYGEWEQPE